MNRELNSPKDVVTEADADIRVVLPYLQAVGVNPDQIRAQRTFKIRLGRNANIEVGGKDVRTGRLDYLVVNSENRPLFVVELKSPDVALTDDDRDQGISYARLVHPIAPLVLVTNTKESRLYDTITKELVSTPLLASTASLSYSAEDALRARYEALQFFVGYSTENVAAFSAAQRQARMQTVRGAGQYTKKYEPDLYVPRAGSRTAVDLFLASDKVVFALGAESGRGKTNEMCFLGEKLGETHLTLFFLGGEIFGSLGEALTNEFEWHFSERLSLPNLARRLAEIAERSKNPLLIMIDGIDEASLASLPEELAELAHHLEGFNGRIRLIVSAKPSEWQEFVQRRGEPTLLANTVFRGMIASADQNGDGVAESSFSYVLGMFTEEECDTAIQKYSDVLGISGHWTGQMRIAARDPFLLRMVAEVASQTGRLPDDPAEPDLVRRYVKQRISRTLDPERAMRELVAVGTALTKDQTTSYRSNGHASDWPTEIAGPRITVQESVVARLARLASTESISQELVSFGLLIRIKDVEGRSSLAFAYDRIRDYIIATHVYALETLAGDAFRDISREAFDSAAGADALLWYLPQITGEQWQGFLVAVERRIHDLLNAYGAIRQLFSVEARQQMDLPGSGSLGAVFACDPQRKWFDLAFFDRVDQTVPSVIFDPTLFNALRGFEATRKGSVPITRVGTVRGGLGFWYLRNPKVYAAELALTGLKKILKKGGLPEALDDILLIERVVALTNRYRRRLGLADQSGPTARVADHYIPTDLFPLILSDLFARVQRELALKHFQNEYVTELIQAERTRIIQLPDSARPGTISVQVEWNDTLLELARARAVKELKAGRVFLEVQGESALSALARAIDLLKRNVARIDSFPLPAPDMDRPWSTRSFEDGYTDERLASLLEQLFALSLKSWHRIADATFDPKLGLILKQPAERVGIVCRRPQPTESHHGDFWSMVWYGPLEGVGDEQPAESTVVAVVATPGAAKPYVQYEHDQTVILKSSRGEFIGRLNHWTTMQMLMSPHNAPDFCDGSNSAHRYAPIRGRLYSFAVEAFEDLTADDLIKIVDEKEIEK